MTPLFFIVGPTGVGKSEIAATVAARCHGEVIGADAYLTKPYDFSDLFEAIKKILPDS